MPKIKFMRRILIVAMLSVAVASLEKGLAHADDTTALLKTRCINSGLGNASRDSTDITINRQIYTSLFYLAPGDRSAAITCKIVSGKHSQPKLQALDLDFGMRDDDLATPTVTVNVYLDGNLAASKELAPAKRASIALNTSNASNVSVETVCSTQSQYCGRVYFFKATLARKKISPR